MQTFRRFLVLQALMIWQGGFFFYAAVVVPTGTRVLGSWWQAQVTRHVTDRMNVIGAVALIILGWDQLSAGGLRRARWALWGVMAGGLVALAILHPAIEGHVEFGVEGRVVDYPAFYLLHRIYLYVATVQWVAALTYVAVTLRAWHRSGRLQEARGV
ncbi:MAG TPA: hypothetical protein VKE40_00815 [Gemmataceae bacterium]|nr:hypothetical protein [Gemmataceae bacterium]